MSGEAPPLLLYSFLAQRGTIFKSTHFYTVICLHKREELLDLGWQHFWDAGVHNCRNATYNRPRPHPNPCYFVTLSHYNCKTMRWKYVVQLSVRAWYRSHVCAIFTIAQRVVTHRRAQIVPDQDQVRQSVQTLNLLAFQHARMIVFAVYIEISWKDGTKLHFQLRINEVSWDGDVAPSALSLGGEGGETVLMRNLFQPRPYTSRVTTEALCYHSHIIIPL
jgi:hypothetical protein